MSNLNNVVVYAATSFILAGDHVERSTLKHILGKAIGN
nr:MAG TPA: hypothetical protein [Caudoviricetes sp.]